MQKLYNDFIDTTRGVNFNSNQLHDDSIDSYEHHWTGKVLDNNDPLMMGRCKIRIFGYYDDIADSAIPWALPETSYLGSRTGALVVPENGTLVRGYFDVGDDQKPIYNAIAPNMDNYMNSHDMAETMLNYPNLMTLFSTDKKDRLTVNRSNGEMVLTHRSGTTITIDPTGALSIKTAASIINKSNLTVEVNGDVDITAVNGRINLQANKSPVNINAVGGDVNIGNDAVDKEANGVTVPSPAKQHANNLPMCLVTGSPHCINPTNNVYI